MREITDPAESSVHERRGPMVENTASTTFVSVRWTCGVHDPDAMGRGEDFARNAGSAGVAMNRSKGQP